jgi:sortase A
MGNPVHPREERRPVSSTARWPVPARGLERVLWVFSALALGIALWMKADAWVYQWRSSWELAPPLAGAAPVEPRQVLPAGTPLARLSIPRLDLSVVVAEGTDHRVLRRAVGHLPRSARPGEGGNIALAAHRDTFFRGLADLQAGDPIVLESDHGHQAYQVEWTRVVSPEETAVVAPTVYPALTLVTCYPFGYLGRAPERYVVRARLASMTLPNPVMGSVRCLTTREGGRW